MKTFNTQQMIEGAKLEIERIAPKNSHIEIEVTEDPVGHFKTNVMLKTKYHTYFAKKEDLFLYKSFSKAVRALKAQLQKRKIGQINHETPRIDNFHPAA
jgi:ribosome-associated translation inhibitor RaiA